MEEEISISKLEFVNILIENPQILSHVTQYRENLYQYVIDKVYGTKSNYKIPWVSQSTINDKKKIRWHFQDLYDKFKWNRKQKSRGTPLNHGFTNDNWLCHENYPNLFPSKIISNQER